MIIIRFTDFYCIASNSTYDNLVSLLCVNITPTNLTYLKPLKFAYFNTEDEDFNYMLYEKEKISELHSYNSIFTKAITSFVEQAYTKYKERNIVFIYDDNVIETFGKELYYNSITESIKHLETKYNTTIGFTMKHIINAIPGEVISTETGFNSIYHLDARKYTRGEVSKKNICPGLIDAALWQDTSKLTDSKLTESTSKTTSTESNSTEPPKIEYPYKPYIIHSKRIKYGRDVATYMTIVDFGARKTFYYTYSLINCNVELYSTETINIGFMDIIDWIRSKSSGEINIYHKFKDTLKSITYLSTTKSYFYNFGITVTKEDFYTNSPIKEITKKAVDIKREIMDKHFLDFTVIFTYNIENVIELPLKHIELQQESFNGHCHRVVENYNYLVEALNKKLRFSGSFRSEDLVDMRTGKHSFKLDVLLSDVGYVYTYSNKDELEIF